MSTAADKPVRHILALSGGKPASYVRALDMLDPILTRHYPRPIVGGSRGGFKDGDTSSKSQRKASELKVNCAELKAAAKKRIDQQPGTAGIKYILRRVAGRAFRRATLPIRNVAINPRQVGDSICRNNHYRNNNFCKS